ncbi:MAG: hypothetical protein ACE366_00150 [Bradymonadia bacterium]
MSRSRKADPEDAFAFETAMADVTPLLPRAGNRLPGKAPEKGPVDPGIDARKPVDKGTLRAMERNLAHTRSALHGARAELAAVKEERDEWIERARAAEGMWSTLKVEISHLMQTQPPTVPLVDLLAKDTPGGAEAWAERMLELLLTERREALLDALRITAEGFETWRAALEAPTDGDAEQA